jgi:hypothetical protein
VYAVAHVDQAAIIFPFVIGSASKKVCIGGGQDSLYVWCGAQT